MLIYPLGEGGSDEDSDVVEFGEAEIDDICEFTTTKTSGPGRDEGTVTDELQKSTIKDQILATRTL